jgi:hypothetical protein
MFDRFVRLCEIASPTGQEREVADAIMDELRGEGSGLRMEAVRPGRRGPGEIQVRGRASGWSWFRVVVTFRDGVLRATTPSMTTMKVFGRQVSRTRRRRLASLRRVTGETPRSFRPPLRDPQPDWGARRRRGDLGAAGLGVAVVEDDAAGLASRRRQSDRTAAGG